MPLPIARNCEAVWMTTFLAKDLTSIPEHIPTGVSRLGLLFLFAGIDVPPRRGQYKVNQSRYRRRVGTGSPPNCCHVLHFRVDTK